jgi:hypothetical protein
MILAKSSHKTNPKKLIVRINIAKDRVVKSLCPKDNNGFRNGA